MVLEHGLTLCYIFLQILQVFLNIPEEFYHKKVYVLCFN